MVDNPLMTQEPRSRRRSLKLVIYLVIGALAVLAAFEAVQMLSSKLYFMPSESMSPTLQAQDHIICNRAAYLFSSPQRGDVVAFFAPPEADNVSPVGQKQEKEFVKRVVAISGDEVRITPGYVQVGDCVYGHVELRQLLSRKDPFTATVRIVSRRTVIVDGRPLGPKEIAAAAGEPGARVRMVPGRVYVNGAPIEESYVKEDTDTKYPDSATPNKWVAVDNSGHSVVRIPKGRLLVMGDNRNNAYDSRYWGLLDENRVIGKVTRIVWPAKHAGPVK